MAEKYRDKWKQMTIEHYRRGGWYSQNGQCLTLDEVLNTHGDFCIHYPNEPIVSRGAMQYCMKKLYPPSLWAHGGKRVTVC